MRSRLANYVRARRRSAGLSQRELARIIGYEGGGLVSGHELFSSIPHLLTALAYEATFQEPVSELFAGLREAVESAVEKRLAEFEASLLGQCKSTSPRPDIARKIAWLRKRRRMISG